MKGGLSVYESVCMYASTSLDQSPLNGLDIPLVHGIDKVYRYIYTRISVSKREQFFVHKAQIAHRQSKQKFKDKAQKSESTK